MQFNVLTSNLIIFLPILNFMLIARNVLVVCNFHLHTIAINCCFGMQQQHTQPFFKDRPVYNDIKLLTIIKWSHTDDIYKKHSLLMQQKIFFWCYSWILVSIKQKMFSEPALGWNIWQPSPGLHRKFIFYVNGDTNKCVIPVSLKAWRKYLLKAKAKGQHESLSSRSME